MENNNSFYELHLEASLQELFRLIECIIEEIEDEGIYNQALKILQRLKRLSDNFLILCLTFSDMPYEGQERLRYIEQKFIFEYLSRDIERSEPQAWKEYKKLSPKILEVLSSIYRCLY
jgi:hypothetical protein